MEEIEALYRLYAPAVLRFSIGLTGSVNRAEDLVSETFLRCMLRAPQIRTQTALAYRSTSRSIRKCAGSSKPVTDSP